MIKVMYYDLEKLKVAGVWRSRPCGVVETCMGVEAGCMWCGTTALLRMTSVAEADDCLPTQDGGIGRVFRPHFDNISYSGPVDITA
jgi:hypothetical protein